MPPTPTAPSRGAQAIDRAGAVLALVARHHAGGIPLCDLVAGTGLDRTTTWRIASALERQGLLQRSEDSLYRLGLMAMAMGAATMDRPPLVEQCRPVMKALARLSGDNVFLVVRHGDNSLCLHLEEGAHRVRSFPFNVGSTRLLGLGVASIALLARLSDEALAQHHARHRDEYQSHEVGLPRLLRLASTTRERGYSNVSAHGVAGVGMWLPLGTCGDAAMSVLAPRSRLPKERAEELALAMRHESRRGGLGQFAGSTRLD